MREGVRVIPAGAAMYWCIGRNPELLPSDVGTFQPALSCGQCHKFMSTSGIVCLFSISEVQLQGLVVSTAFVFRPIGLEKNRGLEVLTVEVNHIGPLG